jgi:hypothetical protein
VRGWLALAVFAATLAQGAEMPTIQQVKAAHEKRLLALPGVVSIGIGRDAQGREAIVIGLDRARPETEAQLPRALDDYPVRVQILGPIRAQDPR